MELTEQDYQKVMCYFNMYGNAEGIIDNPLLREFIEDAASSVNSVYFGDRVHKAVALIAMHNITVGNELAKGGAFGGKVVSKSIGPVSVTYAVEGRRGSEYSGTRYGRMYLELLQSCGGGISVTGAGRFC